MVLYNINRPVEPPHQLQPKTLSQSSRKQPRRGSPSPAGLFPYTPYGPLQKKSEKFKKSVDNYRPREYNIRVLATIAQLAEHLIRNERVHSSNLCSGSKTLESNRLYGWVLFLYTNEPNLAKNVCHLFPHGFSTLRL